MKVTKILSRISILAIAFVLSATCVFGQSVTYNVIDNTPYTSSLTFVISPFDFILLAGDPMGGPDLKVKYRPMPRLKLEANIGSAMYMKSLETDTLGAIKNLGGLFVEVGGEFIWKRKGVNFTKEKGDTTPIKTPFQLDGSYSNGVSTSRFIRFPFNRMVERGIRGGIMYRNIAWEASPSTITGGYVGISKRGIVAATLDIEGFGERSRHNILGYHFDIMFGSSTLGPMPTGEEKTSGSGYRFGIDYLNKGGLAPIAMTFEFGKLPTVDGGFMRLKFATELNFGKDFYKGGYKYRRRAKKTIPILIQNL